MTARGAEAERARLFVALELPDEVRSALVAWSGEVGREVPGLRWLAPESMHVTLCFLGWRASSEVAAISEACAAVVDGSVAGELALSTPVWLPARRPRVLAIEVTDPTGAAARVQASLSTVLSSGGWYQPETRPFLAHATVARVASGARVRPVELKAPPAVAWRGTRVTLFQSVLGRGGAQYQPLRTVALGGGEDQGAPAGGSPRRGWCRSI